MIINIKASGIELTDAIRQYVEEKIEGLTKFFDNITQADVDIGMESHHHLKGKIYYAEVNLHVPQRSVFIRKHAEDLYKAIDKVKDHLKVDLEKMKGKMRHHDREILRDQKEYQPE